MYLSSINFTVSRLRHGAVRHIHRLTYRSATSRANPSTVETIHRFVLIYKTSWCRIYGIALPELRFQLVWSVEHR
jgi:hypothetical protein